MEAEKVMNWIKKHKNKILNRYTVGFNIFFSICLVLIFGINIIFPSIERKKALKIDLTGNKLYTLSEETCKILQNLEEEIYIYMIYSPGNIDFRIQELLAEYGASSSKVKVIFLSQEILQSTSERPPLLDIENGVIITNKDRSIEQIFSYEDFYLRNDEGQNISFKAETKITAAIQGIVRGAFCNIRLLTGHGETTRNELERFIQLLDIGNFQIDSYDLSTSTQQLDAQTDILVIVSPKADLEHSEYETISQFMQQGGRILLFLDRSSFNMTQGILQIYTTEMPLFSQLLADYNIKINDDLIISRSVDSINLRRTSFRATPLMNVLTEELCDNHWSVVVNEAASLSFLEKEGVQVQMLLAADSDCFAKKLSSKIENFNYQEGDRQGVFIVGALSEKVTSQLAVITDSQCIGDEALSAPGNHLFFENLLKKLSPLETLISIESKELVVPELQLSDLKPEGLFILAGMILLPIAVFYIGIRMRTRKWKK